MMKLLILTIFLCGLLSPFSAANADPREYNHGAVVKSFMDDYGEIKYYVTWSSSYGTAWEHDIYREVIHFEWGELQIDDGPKRFIGNGSDEAQEPVSAAINEGGGNIVLTAFEDGSGASVDVRGQLHNIDGTVIKSNWIIAGDDNESQHSAAVSQIGDFFLVAYADETPVNGVNGTIIKVKVLNDQNGSEVDTLQLTPNGEDHWWPVTIDNRYNHAFVGWGDGYEFYGSVLSTDGNSVSYTQPQSYFYNITQYHYQVIWLDELDRFLVIVERPRPNKTWGNSLVALIDTQGDMTVNQVITGWPIIREAQPAAKWDDLEQAYKVVYPTRKRDVAVLKVSSNSITKVTRIRGKNNSVLKNITWPSTGIAALFVADNDGQDEWWGENVVLFVTNQDSSNDVLHLPVHIEAGF